MKEIKKENIYLIIVSLIIIFNERVFYLLDSTNKIHWLVIYSLTFLLFIYFSGEMVKHKFKFSKTILVMNCIIIINFFRTYYVFGQPLDLSLSTYKYTFILLLYFPLCIIFAKVNLLKLKTLIILISTIASLIYFIQKMVYPNFIFLNVFFSERFGEVRFFNGISLITLGFFITLSLLFEKKSLKNRVILSSSIVLQLSFIIFVAQSRNIILPLVFILLLVLIKEMISNDVKKIFLNGSIILILIISVFPYFKEMTDSILNDIGRDSGSAYIRVLSQEYFLDKIKQNLFLGYGLFSDSYAYGSFLKGTYYKYFAEDVGLIGLTFQFGVIYSLIYILVFLKIILGAFNNKFNKKEKMWVIYFSVFTLLYSPFSVLLNVDNSLLIFILFISLYDSITSKKRLEIEENDKRGIKC